MKFICVAAVFAGLAAPGFGSGITVPGATVTADIDQCTTSVCTNSFLVQNLTGVTLSTFGDSYTITNDPTTGSNTPGDTPGSIAAATSTTSASGMLVPSLSSQVTSGFNVANSAQEVYYFEVMGASGPVSVQVSATGSTTASTSLSSSATQNVNTLASLVIYQSSTAVVFDTVSLIYSDSLQVGGPCIISDTSSSSTTGTGATSSVSSSSGIGCTSSNMTGGFSESGSYIFAANTVEEVILTANITAGTTTGDNGTVAATASVDPIITVPAGYTLVESAGIGNGAAATPEPGTWMLAAASLALMCALKRRGGFNPAGRFCVRGR